MVKVHEVRIGYLNILVLQVWVLRVDVHIYDTNGCLAEAAALSVLGGLLTFQRPQAYVDVNTEKLVVHGLEDATPVRLHLHHLPVLTSFALTEGGRFLAEPDQDEEEVSIRKCWI